MPAGVGQTGERAGHLATIAETLQRSVLSERLPEIAGLRLAAHYRAGSAEATVGGDWYDVLALRGGRAGIAIGDIVGHGINAAARMAHLKSAMCAYALEGLRPSVVLERMNGFVRQVQAGRMATVLYGVVDPGEDQLRLASAGHPPALLVEGTGDARYIEGRPASPLGVLPFPSYEETLVGFPPGAVVLLYTDGLIERPGTSLDAGLDWLRDFAASAPSDPAGLSRAVLDACCAERPPRDDVALLAVSVEPLSPDGIELTLPADPESLAPMRRNLARWLERAGATEVETYELLVACGEVCSNAITHAYPPGEASYEVTARWAAGQIELQVRDRGSWREPRDGAGNGGLALVEKLVDQLEVERHPTGTVVTMRRRLVAGESR